MRCHAIPCQSDASPLPSHPAHPSIPCHPTAPVPSHPAPRVPSYGRQSVAKCCRKRREGKKEAIPVYGLRRRCRVEFSGSHSLPQGFPSHSAESTFCCPCTAPWDQRFKSRGAWAYLLPSASARPTVIGFSAQVHYEHKTQCMPSVGQPASQSTWAINVSSEPLRADSFISRNRWSCLIVNLEPGPFEVHG